MFNSKEECVMVEEKVESFLKQKRFILNGKRLLVGVSGGPDSLALLHYLWKQQEQYDFSITVAHVDHMFRGMESYNEAKFVEAFCAVRGIPFRMTRMNVPEYMKESGKSSQVSSRECRYQFFAKVMKELRLDYLVLAHHGDDQIETMLMRLTRGSSGAARAGIPFLRPFQNGYIVRPFLCLNRDEIERYCGENQLNPRRDPSNEKDVYLRNRFRKYVVPFLQRENSRVHEHFQRFSEELQEDEQFLQELALQKMSTVCKDKQEGLVTIDINAFQDMAIPLQRRVVQLILNYLYEKRSEKRPESLSAIHIEHFFSLIEGPHPSGSLDFPDGLKVIRSYRICHFCFDSIQTEEFHVELDSPGVCILPNGDSIILEETDHVPELHNLGPYTFKMNPEDAAFPIVIRTREPGDRMSLKGMKGTRKIKSIFIDEKIPLEQRGSWPVVTDGNGQILWLPGLKKSAMEMDYEKGTKALLFTYKRAGHQQ
ncbi:tRNA lysidine(34) synthetase TilS [Bacillus benzoevorans]|uniref:tRNA(Ile)-lysidine synthase n=1 Tax=Bacillus benzoevorans TaxID=1456 RepID=A0A7X0HV37_9BACI|nr:tRNA lysidine(34) synthetase TilS [Bacillus benzoevorans]MBB6447457.1 tRNA(Ile)-lysidine synthase [Bacillus benzoevorans]